MTRITRGLWIVLALAPFVAGCQSPIVTLYAQSLPATLHALWTPNPATDNISQYAVILDGGSPQAQSPSVCTPTLCTGTFTVGSYGSHNLVILASNVYLSAPGVAPVNQDSAPSAPVAFTLSASPRSVTGGAVKP